MYIRVTAKYKKPYGLLGYMRVDFSKNYFAFNNRLCLSSSNPSQRTKLN